MSDVEWYRSAFDAPYLEVYAHRDAAEAAQATETLLRPLGLAGARVLDLACGAGRWLLPLAMQGARLVGCDLSASLLAEARTSLASWQQQAEPAGGAIQLVQGDMRDLPFRSAAFDLVLSLFTSFGYFASEAHDRKVLGEVWRVTRPGGRFLLDIFNAERLRQHLEPEAVRRAGRWQVHERRWLDVVNNTVVKEIRLSAGGVTRRYREVVRLWDQPRLFEALQQAGLEVEASWGSYAGDAYDAENSPRLVVQSRRTAAPA